MGCGGSTTNFEIESDDTNNIKYYKHQSIGSFNREIILCHGCKKCFSLGSNQIKLNCSACNKFFHCNIAGECMGKKCLFKFNNTTIRARYCKDCSTYKGDNECICHNCK